MEATTRIRLFHTRSTDEEEGRAARGQRRRVDSVGRGRRRRHRRASYPRLFFGILRTRQAMMLLLLVTGAAGPFVSLRLLAWASSNMPRAPADGSRGSSGGIESPGKDKPPSFSLGPDSIPSVLRVERRASSSARPGVSAPPAHPGHGPPGLREGKGSSLSRTPTLPGGKDADREKRRHVCKNTVQGVALIADSEGRVCRRAELDRGRPGCCNALPLSSATGGGNLPDAATEVIPSMEGHVTQDTPALPPPPRALTSLRPDMWRKGAEDVKEVFTPRVLTAAAAARQLAGRERGDEVGFPPKEALSTPFSCWSCDAGVRGGTSSSCCASYEFCVSCCQDPRRKEEREVVQAAAVRSGHPAYGSLGYGGGGSSGAVGGGKVLAPALPLGGEGGPIDDEASNVEVIFDICAFRCRTYSGSVFHENSFRSPLKHCFGRFRPPADPRGASNGGDDGDDGAVASQGGGTPPLQLDPLLVGFIST